MDGFLYWKRLEVRTEGVVQGLIGQRGGGEGGLHQGWDGGGGRPLVWMSPPLHLDSSDLCQHGVKTLGYLGLSLQLPSDFSLLPLTSFFVTGGLNLFRMRFLRKSQSSAEMIEMLMRKRKRKTCNGSRSILIGSRVVTVVEYCYQNYNTVTTKHTGVIIRHTRPVISATRIEII